MKKQLQKYINQIPKGLDFTVFCNKLEALIDTDYINDIINKGEQVDLKLIEWKKYYR